MNNKSIEELACDKVKKCLAGKDWHLEERRRAGCDMIFSKQGKTIYVEVKGSSKRSPGFRYFTDAEHRLARRYRDRYRIYIVTGIGTRRVDCYCMTGNALLAAQREIRWRVDIRFND